MVVKLESEPWPTPGKKPRPMFVYTMSSKVLVAFLNSTENQFSKLVRRASTCPSKTVETAGEVEPACLWRTMESKSSMRPSGMSLLSSASKSEKNSPWPSALTSAPEKERVEPANGLPVAETTPEVKVEEA